MKLAKREKLFVSAGAGILGIILILQLLVIPFFDKKNQLEKETDTLEELVNEMVGKGLSGQDMAEISGGLERILSTRKENLSTLIYREAEASGIKTQNIGGMDSFDGKNQGGYQEDILALELKAITLSQLTQFLYRIEKPEKFIFITRASIRDNKKDDGYLDADIRVMSYKKENSEQ